MLNFCTLDQILILIKKKKNISRNTHHPTIISHRGSMRNFSRHYFSKITAKNMELCMKNTVCMVTNTTEIQYSGMLFLLSTTRKPFNSYELQVLATSCE